MGRIMKVGENLTGSLLVAHPDLRDPNFRRTIIFLSQHIPEEGATGFVLNRPIPFEADGGP
jgi:putative transcriptional regulator